MKTNSEEIWKKAVSGDQQAWQQLYRIFGGKVYQFFLRNTRNPELSQDKTQEIFLKIYRNKESFKYGSLKTWIFRIVRNSLIDEWRKAGNREILTEVLPEIIEADNKVEETVIDSIEHDQLIESIDACLDRLSCQERLVIGLVYLAGLTISELAEVMEIPLGTAKTNVRNARLRLDAMLSERLQIKKFEKSL
ncbi:MAG: sigma-70 family RNA polymerase sigma factor [Candidatus Rifleibacteriota bacterium]